jgi:hypothetical protein
MGRVKNGYEIIENIYNQLVDLVDHEDKLHPMDMSLIHFHLEDLKYEIIPRLEEIV